MGDGSTCSSDRVTTSLRRIQHHARCVKHHPMQPHHGSRNQRVWRIARLLPPKGYAEVRCGVSTGSNHNLQMASTADQRKCMMWPMNRNFTKPRIDSCNSTSTCCVPSVYPHMCRKISVPGLPPFFVPRVMRVRVGLELRGFGCAAAVGA